MHVAEICDLTTARIKMYYGAISKPETWCALVNAGEPTAGYKGAREQVKAGISVPV